jgi:hypothetical protein
MFSYKINTATLASMVVDGVRIPVTIPGSSVVSIAKEKHGEPLLEIEWEGKRMFMFAIDLRERCEPARRAEVQAKAFSVHSS